MVVWRGGGGRPFYSSGMRITWLLTVVAAVGTGACQSSGSDTAALVGDGYVEAIETICADTNARLDALPSPPDGISATDWADEVALAFGAESERTRDLLVDGSLRSTHLDFATTTSELAGRYRALSTTIVDDPDGIGAISTEITELTLGRNDLASELGVNGCVRDGS
ncbi:hypothetical protein YM304_37170 [Ilumatobacter coccineus YM16-304]|uniref:Uncharacterized protein n=2 Tax=Ilumatobacter coccineus TaxID=467094 RepID=A0A6C7EC32_ILUCY|nr:hypothetical protein YM304_37170 [Ilumatobacter coccineus YM16-304]